MAILELPLLNRLDSQIERKQEISASLLKEQIASDGKSTEILLGVGERSYPVVLARALGAGIVNPSEEMVNRMLLGELSPVNPLRRLSLIVPLQGDGRCAAGCDGCVFASNRNSDGDKQKATPVDRRTMSTIIDTSLTIGEQRGILEKGESVGYAALMSGDPSFNRNTTELIKFVGQHSRISHSRWSTIGVRAINNPLDSFVQAADWLEQNQVNHRARFQVSLHSLEDEKRSRYVSPPGFGFPLLPKEEIAEAFARIHSLTGLRSTIAFVVDEQTTIDCGTLRSFFNPETTAISLRSRIPLPNEQLDIRGNNQKLIRISNELQNDNWDVLVVPTIKDGLEQINLAHQ